MIIIKYEISIPLNKKFPRRFYQLINLFLNVKKIEATQKKKPEIN